MENSPHEYSRELSPDSLSNMLPPWELPPETAEEEGGKRLKLDPEPETRDLTTNELMTITYEEVQAMYDNASRPYWVKTPTFEYKNKARLEVDKAIAEYRKQCRGLGPFGKRPLLPPNADLLGGIYAYPITDANRARLVELSNAALAKYNADNQGAKFEFAELVWTNMAVCAGPMYYITFEAKCTADGATHTFQAKVWDRIGDMGAEVQMCQMKPS